ncbi:MAG: hypothetical protein WCK39_00955 [Methanomassiliicoccales archaeon]
MVNAISLFYQMGGYESSSDYEGRPTYIALESATGLYLPYGVSLFNRLCTGSIQVALTNGSTGDLINDRIVAELGLSFADAEYDKLHVDPDTGRQVNRHKESAYDLMLSLYGKKDKFGRLTFPVYIDYYQPYGDLGVADVTY